MGGGGSAKVRRESWLFLLQRLFKLLLMSPSDSSPELAVLEDRETEP